MDKLLLKLGNKISLKRKKLGISQEEFANRIEMDRAYYSSIENGKHNISILQLKKIADGLHEKISDLLSDL